MLSAHLGVKEINVKKAGTNLVFDDFSAFSKPELMRAIDEFEGVVHISMASKPTLEFALEKEENSKKLCTLREFLSLTV